MEESFITYQRQMWITLANLGVSRFYVDITKKGKYVIRQKLFANILYWILWTNNHSKFIYHTLTYHGLLGVKVHFLDQMSIVDWWLMYFHVVMEGFIWFFKYPMWENLYRQWELQQDIYRKLGRPVKAAQNITRTDRINFVLYGGVCIIGTLALIVQFFTTPKYALNTYAIVPADTLLLRIIFCIHECLFMIHGYAYQAFTMVLAESYAVSYQHILEEMNKCLGSIVSKEKLRQSQCQPVSKLNPSKLTNTLGISTPLDPKKTASGTEYNIRTLVEDYKKIMISAQFHNQWIGFGMGFPEAVNYMQFVSDVFMTIQLLKEPEMDYFGVFFYIMDAAFGMTMIFRMLIILSRLYPQAEEFIQGLKLYASMNTPMRKELTKTITALKLVSAKLTGGTVKPKSVPVGINALINSYIAAAMWHRPDDPSRRT